MVRQYIELGDAGWHIYVYYGVDKYDYNEVVDSLFELGCPKNVIKKSIGIITKKLNTGLTFTNSEYKTSLVCISNATSAEQFVNTIIHESKHVLSHICSYYNINEDSELAAYLIGHIVLRMYKMLQRLN